MLLTNRKLSVSLFLLALFLSISPSVKAQWGFLRLVEWSPAGDRIAVATTDTVWVYDTSGTLIASSGPTGRIVSISWSPDGERLAVLSINRSAGQWTLDIKSAVDLTNLLTVKETQDFIIDEPKALWSPASNDQMLLIATSVPRVLDANTGKTLLALETQNLYVNDGGWNADGTRIVIASTGGLLVWDAYTGTLLDTIMFENNLFYLLIVIPDSSHLLIANGTGQQFGDIEIWNATLSEVVTVLPGPDNTMLTDLSWSQGNLASSTTNGIIKVWDLANEQVLFTYEEGGRVESISWSPDGSQLAYGGGDGTLKIISLPTPIAPNPDTLRAKIAECVPDQGLQTSLLAKVNAGQFGALINEVEALPENKLTNSCAGQIINMAQYFIENPPGGSE